MSNNDPFPLAAAAAALRNHASSPVPSPSPIPSKPPSRTASLRNMTRSPAFRHHHRRNSSTGLTQTYQALQDPALQEQPAFSNKFQSFQSVNGHSASLSRSSSLSLSSSLRLSKRKPAHRGHLSLSRSSTIRESGPAVTFTASTVTNSSTVNGANSPRIAWDHQSQTLVMIRPTPAPAASAAAAPPPPPAPSGPSRHARSRSDNLSIADLGIGMTDANLLRRNRIERRASLPHRSHQRELSTTQKVVETNDDNHNRSLLKRQPLNKNEYTSPSTPHIQRPHPQNDSNSSFDHDYNLSHLAPPLPPPHHHHNSRHRHHASNSIPQSANVTVTDATSPIKNVSHGNLVRDRSTVPALTLEAGKDIITIDDDSGQVNPTEKDRRKGTEKKTMKKKNKKKIKKSNEEMATPTEKRMEKKEETFQEKKEEPNLSKHVNVNEIPKADRKPQHRTVNFDATPSVPREIDKSAGKSVVDSMINTSSSSQLRERKKVEGRTQGEEEEDKDERKPHPEETRRIGLDSIPVQPTLAVLPSGVSGSSFVNEEKANQVDLQGGTVAIPTPSKSTSSVIVQKSQTALDRDVDVDVDNYDEKGAPEIHTSEQANISNTATEQPEDEGSQSQSLSTDKLTSITSSSSPPSAAAASPSSWGVSYWLKGWNVGWFLPSWSSAKDESSAKGKADRDGFTVSDLDPTPVGEDDGKSIYMDANEQWTDGDSDDDDGRDDLKSNIDISRTCEVEKESQRLLQSLPSITSVEPTHTSPSISDAKKSEKVLMQAHSKDEQLDSPTQSSSKPPKKPTRRKHRSTVQIITVPDEQETDHIAAAATATTTIRKGKENQTFATTKGSSAGSSTAEAKRSHYKSSKSHPAKPASTTVKPKSRRSHGSDIQTEAQSDLYTSVSRPHKRTKPKRKQAEDSPSYSPDIASKPKSIHVSKTRKPYRNDVAKSDLEDETFSLPRTNVTLPALSPATVDTRSPVGTTLSGVGRNSRLSSDGSSTLHPVTDLYSLGSSINGSASSFKRKPIRRGSKRGSVFTSLRMGRSASIRSSSSTAAAPPPQAALTDMTNVRAEKSLKFPSPLLTPRLSSSSRHARPTSPLVAPSSRSSSPAPPSTFSRSRGREVPMPRPPRAPAAFSGTFTIKPRRRFSISSSDDDSGGGGGVALLSSLSQNIRSHRRWDDSSSDSSDDDADGGRRRMGMSMRKEESGKRHGTFLQKIGLDRPSQEVAQQPQPQEQQEQQQHVAVPELRPSPSAKWSTHKSSKGDKPAKRSIFSIFSKSSRTASKAAVVSPPTSKSPTAPSSIPNTNQHSSGVNDAETQFSKSYDSTNSLKVSIASATSPRNSAQYHRQQQQQQPLNTPSHLESPRRLSGVSSLSPVAEGSPAQSSNRTTPADANTPNHKSSNSSSKNNGNDKGRESTHSETVPGDSDVHVSGKKSRLPLRSLLTRSQPKSPATRLQTASVRTEAATKEEDRLREEEGALSVKDGGKKLRRHHSFLGRKR